MKIENRLYELSQAQMLRPLFIIAGFIFVIGFAVAFLPPKYVQLIAVLMIGVPFLIPLIDGGMRRSAVVLLLAFVPLTGILKALTGSRFAPLTFDIGIWMACIFCLFDGLIRKRLRIGFVDWTLGVFLALSFVQMFNPNVPDLQTGIEGFRKFAFMSIAFYVGRHILLIRQWKLFEGLLLYLSPLISVYAIKQFFFISSLEYRMIELATSSSGTYLMGGQLRPFSTMPGPFHLGLYLVTTILLVFLYLMRSDTNLRFRYFLVIILVPQLVALFMTRTKGNWMGLAVGTIFIILVSNKNFTKKLLNITVVAFLVVGIAITLLNYSSGTSQIVLQDAVAAVSNPMQAPTFQYRLQIWQEFMVPAIAAHPFIGYGTSSAGEGLGPSYAGTNSNYFASHNLYIKIILELGLPGLCLFLVVVGNSIHSGRRLMRKIHSMQRIESITVYWALAVVLSFFVAGFVVPVLDAYPVNYYFWLFLGFLSRERISETS